ncbi:MAG: aminoglycoside phosphotransferase family protein [Caulobacterales bacterium]
METAKDRVKRAYDADQANPKKAVKLGDVPTRYELITPEWLSAILCKDARDAKVTGFELGPKNDGSSNRRRISITYNAAGSAAGLPSSVFCKAAESMGNRVILGPTGTAQGEVDFFGKVRSRLDIEAPVGLYGAFDPETFNYIVMMHDLTGKATFFDDHTTVLSRDQAEQMVRLLARLHARFYESADIGTPALPYLTWPDWWTRMMQVSPDFGTSCDRGFAAAESVLPARLFARAKEIWPLTTESVERHRKLPKTINHCDVHLKNWYVTNEGKMGLADWQIVTIGHWSRDLIYALSTSLTVENRRAWLDDLIRIYLDESASLGMPRTSFDEAMLLCRQQTMSALAFWTITLCPADGMPAMQPEGLTFEWLKRIGALMDDLDAVDSFS